MTLTPPDPVRASDARLSLVATPHATELASALASARGQAGDAVVGVRSPQPLAAAASAHRAALLHARTGTVALEHAQPIAATPQAVAFLFPGLGDHYLGMGLDLYRSFAVFRDAVDRCAALVQPELGVDLREIIYPDREAPVAPAKLDLRRMLGRGEPQAPSPAEARLNETRHAQCALFVIEYALAMQWQAWGLAPHVMLGYSLGEYVAACLAGVLSLEDSLTLVARRAAMIETLPAGAMLAILLPEPEVAALLAGEPALSLSAVSSPEMSVIAGPPDDIARVDHDLRGRGVTVRRVQSGHAFHSRMMEPIADQLTRLVATYRLQPPRIPYISNVTGALITAAQATDPAYWAAHLCRPVRFADGLRAIAAPLLLEVGPGQTLSSLATATVAERGVLASMRHSLDPEPDAAVLLRALGQLWIRGAAVDWLRFPQATLALGDAEEPAASARPPTTKTEQDLAAIWQTLLHRPALTVESQFFQLGGNSLLATRLIDRVSRTMRVKLPLRRIYEAPTLEGMAAMIDSLRGAAPVTAAAAPAPRIAAPARPPRAPARPMFTLPNGLEVAHLNEAETRHFYDDIFAHRAYVKHGIRIPANGVVLDVGGNIGMFTVFVHHEQPTARVFTFEPAPPLFEIICHNAAHHGIRATLFNYGLSNAERDAPFTFYPHSAGMSSFHPDAEEEKHNLRVIVDNQRKHGVADAGAMAGFTDELLDVRFAATEFTARLRRLSDVLREQGIARVDLMKVDVQKCELEVIEGIDDADWAKFSQIVLEAHDADGRVATLRALFERHGFDVIVEQDEIYAGTNIHNIYALQRGS